MIRPPPRSTLFPHATPCRFSPPATPARAPAHARDLAIEWREISTLIPYARNARTHSDAQIAEIAGRNREFGLTNPVLIDPPTAGFVPGKLYHVLLHTPHPLH